MITAYPLVERIFIGRSSFGPAEPVARRFAIAAAVLIWVGAGRWETAGRRFLPYSNEYTKNPKPNQANAWRSESGDAAAYGPRKAGPQGRGERWGDSSAFCLLPDFDYEALAGGPGRGPSP